MVVSRAVLLNWTTLVFVLLFSALSAYCLGHLDRFYVAQDQLLSDTLFIEPDKYWGQQGSEDVAFSGNTASIINTPGASHTVFQRVALTAPGFYRLSFDASVKDVVSGQKPWWQAGAGVIFYGADDIRQGSQSLLLLSGSKTRNSYSGIVSVDRGTESIDVFFRLIQSGGRFSFSAPKLSRLAEFPLYQRLRIATTIVWGMLALAVTGIIFKRLSGYKLAIAVILPGVAIAGILLPEPVISGSSQFIASILPEQLLEMMRRVLPAASGGHEPITATTQVSKTGHLLIFLLIGLVLGRQVRRTGILFASAVIITLAVATESLQLLVDGRSALITDVYIDCAGGVIGLCIGMFAVKAARKRRGAHRSLFGKRHAHWKKTHLEYR